MADKKIYNFKKKSNHSNPTLISKLIILLIKITYTNSLNP
jgi:hypothetical protein